MSAISKLLQTAQARVSRYQCVWRDKHVGRKGRRTMTEVVLVAAVVREERHGVVRRDVFRVLTYEIYNVDENRVA